MLSCNIIQRLGLRLAGGFVAVALSVSAVGDTLQYGNIPPVDVTLIGVKDGQLVYRTAAGDKKVELAQVKAIQIDAVPDFEAGLAAFTGDKLRAAQSAFEDVYAGSRQDWIRHYAGYYLMQVYDQRNSPVEAAQVFAKLASENADPFFLSKLPANSLAEADDNQKKRIADELNAVIDQAKGKTLELLEDYLGRVGGKKAPAPGDAQNPNGRGNPNAGGGIDAENSAVILPQGIWKLAKKRNQPEGKWDAIDMLAKGRFQEASDAIQPWLSNPKDLPDVIFIKARALLALADEKQDQQLYRDAGLMFMRLVVHYNRANNPHVLVAPAKLEVAYIHKMIDREDIYEQILFGGEGGGGVHLVINDADAYPQYRKRYFQVIGEELPEDEQEQE